MKKIYLVLLPFLLFSCMDDTDEVNKERVQGTWMHEFLNGDETLQTNFTFNSNGTFESQNVRTQSEGEYELGVLSLSTGTYALEGGELVISDRAYFYAEDYENPPATAEELVESDFEYPIAQRVKISFEDNNSAMILLFYECHDIIPSSFSFCAEPKPIRYDRVEE
ncbi:hypothetical protein MM236_12920 [Belliella sp. DSM 107340]|uniref:Lipocalin-like domain-containing protein n=1 Tax=Belliella calami TaxID=2923436 RepID=A0ABS9UQL5_9BACT|nr:hypothetical protein [Belliella calami]MCH7398900.1 hypothetical protein [Belliella calami]